MLLLRERLDKYNYLEDAQVFENQLYIKKNITDWESS